MQVDGKRVLITGASRGIGESLARAFAGAGATVALVARSAGPIEALAIELKGTAHPADLADPDQVDGLLDRVEDGSGPVDIVVNNAGIDLTGGFAETTADQLRQLVAVNLLAPAELCRQAIPRMRRRGGGHLVNVSSLAGVGAFPGLTAYSASKAALTHLTAGLRADLKGEPIGTTVVELGPIPTGMLESVEGYRPTASAFRRFERMGVLVEIPRERVAAAVVDAVRRDRRHVRFPRRAAAFPMMTEAPRRITEILLSGVRARPR